MKLKNKLLALLFGGVQLSYAIAASAGGYVAPVPDIAPVPAPVAASGFTWGGLYGGVALGRSKWNADYELPVVHPAEYREIQESQKIWRPTAPEDMFDGCDYGNNTCPVPVPGTGEWTDAGWTGEWAHDKVVTGRELIKDAYTTTELVKAMADADSVGGFIGYRHQFGQRLVVGAEANVRKTDGVATEVGPLTGTYGENVKSLELQGGIALGRALVYAGAGIADMDGTSGQSLSLGVDYAVTDQVFVGIKATKTEFDKVDGFDISEENIALRVGFKF